MKVKLLKLLRKKFYITYCYNYGFYCLYTPYGICNFDDLNKCKEELRDGILDYARRNYYQYLKIKKICF